jgi:hypothetical protein
LRGGLVKRKLSEALIFAEIAEPDIDGKRNDATKE